MQSNGHMKTGGKGRKGIAEGTVHDTPVSDRLGETDKE